MATSASLGRRLIFPVLLGVAGVAVLLALGIWQMQRLAWKEAILAEIDARIVASPVALPEPPYGEAERFLPVTVEGTATGQELHVLTSADGLGPGYRVVTAFETAGGRRILVDLGHIPLEAKEADRRAEGLVVTGNLHSPQEVDAWTPEPDAGRNIWFARDVPAMAEALGTEAIFVVARDLSQPLAGVTPLPVGTAGIANDHLEYAITWFLLALVWAIMSGVLIQRIARAPRPPS